MPLDLAACQSPTEAARVLDAARNAPAGKGVAVMVERGAAPALLDRLGPFVAAGEIAVSCVRGEEHDAVLVGRIALAEQPPQDVAEASGCVGSSEPVRSLVEIYGAVLHELRTSGPLGLHVEELQERIGDRLVAKAVATLAEEGRVVVRDGLVRRSIAQEQVEGLRFRDEHATGLLQRIRDALRCPAGADIVTHARETMRESDGRGALNAILREARDSFRDDAEAWRSVALTLFNVLAPESREDHPSATGEGGAVRPHTALGRRLYEIERSVDATGIESGRGDDVSGYLHALADASWLVSYGDVVPTIPIARIVRSGGSIVRCVVLAGPRRDGTFLLSSPGTGRVMLDADGMAVGGRLLRLHPDDLAALRGETAALPGAQVEGG